MLNRRGINDLAEILDNANNNQGKEDTANLNGEYVTLSTDKLKNKK